MVHLARMNVLSTPIPHSSASVTVLFWFFTMSLLVFFPPFLSQLNIVKLGGQTLETINGAGRRHSFQWEEGKRDSKGSTS